MGVRREVDRAAGTVTFDYKDYADGARHKPMQLSLEEFIRRLRLHFLPPRFVKIRVFVTRKSTGPQRGSRATGLAGTARARPGQTALPRG